MPRTITDDYIDEIVHQVAEEFLRAITKFPRFNSAHEGWAVLREEVDELWEEVKIKSPSVPAMRKEAIWVAAMAIRFVIDVCEKDRGNEGE